jgi:hypothetical protein
MSGKSHMGFSAGPDSKWKIESAERVSQIRESYWLPEGLVLNLILPSFSYLRFRVSYQLY